MLSFIAYEDALFYCTRRLSLLLHTKMLSFIAHEDALFYCTQHLSNYCMTASWFLMFVHGARTITMYLACEQSSLLAHWMATYRVTSLFDVWIDNLVFVSSSGKRCTRQNIRKYLCANWEDWTFKNWTTSATPLESEQFGLLHCPQRNQ